MIDPKNYRPMSCPICGKFRFSELQPEDSAREYLQCSSCGWVYNLAQVDDPDLPDEENEMSLNEYKEWYQEQLAENPDFSFEDDMYEAEPHLCPVCGKYEFEDIASFDICPHCGWCDDEVMESEPDKWAGCANDLCLNDFIKRYKAQAGRGG